MDESRVRPGGVLEVAYVTADGWKWGYITSHGSPEDVSAPFAVNTNASAQMTPGKNPVPFRMFIRTKIRDTELELSEDLRHKIDKRLWMALNYSPLASFPTVTGWLGNIREFLISEIRAKVNETD